MTVDELIKVLEDTKSINSVNIGNQQVLIELISGEQYPKILESIDITIPTILSGDGLVQVRIK